MRVVRSHERRLYDRQREEHAEQMREHERRVEAVKEHNEREQVLHEERVAALTDLHESALADHERKLEDHDALVEAINESEMEKVRQYERSVRAKLAKLVGAEKLFEPKPRSVEQPEPPIEPTPPELPEAPALLPEPEPPDAPARPPVFEANQYADEDGADLSERERTGHVMVGPIRVLPGMWVLEGPDGALHAVAPEDFERHYEHA